MREYPIWICHKCGNKYGKPRDTIATWHKGKCDVCGKKTMVTEPRDYGTPDFPGHEPAKKATYVEGIGWLMK